MRGAMSSRTPVYSAPDEAGVLLDEDTTRRFMTLPKRVVCFGSRAGAGAGLLLLALGFPLVAAWK